MSSTFLKISLAVFFVTYAVWFYSFVVHTFHMRDFWFYVFFFFVPGGILCGSIWLSLHHQIWVRVIGLIALLPTGAVWLLSLLLVYGDFKIH